MYPIPIVSRRIAKHAMVCYQARLYQDRQRAWWSLPCFKDRPTMLQWLQDAAAKRQADGGYWSVADPKKIFR